jgi:alpha-beta hydrolase superfamily lysophospholipase
LFARFLVGVIRAIEETESADGDRITGCHRVQCASLGATAAVPWLHARIKCAVVIDISESERVEGLPKQPSPLSRAAENGIPIVGPSIPYAPIPARTSLRFAGRRVIDITEFQRAQAVVFRPRQEKGSIVQGPFELTFDVTDQLGLGVRAVMAASLFVPDELPDRLTVIVAAPGGTYTRSYWHLQLPDRDNYSCTAHLTSAGYAVLALDNLGTGTSSWAGDPGDITFETAASANAALASSFTEHVQSGGLASILAPHEDLHLVGIGHSLGGHLTAVQQANHTSYERIAVLGSSFLGFTLLGNPDEAAAIALLQPMAPDTWESGYLEVPRILLRPLFHADDVPEDIIAADNVDTTVLPRQLGVGVIAPMAHREMVKPVDVPVFLAFGDALDVSPDPSAEVACFPNSPEVTLFRVPGSAHHHNVATTRHVLWHRLIHWLKDTSATQASPLTSSHTA